MLLGRLCCYYSVLRVIFVSSAVLRTVKDSSRQYNFKTRHNSQSHYPVQAYLTWTKRLCATALSVFGVCRSVLHSGYEHNLGPCHHSFFLLICADASYLKHLANKKLIHTRESSCVASREVWSSMHRTHQKNAAVLDFRRGCSYPGNCAVFSIYICSTSVDITEVHWTIPSAFDWQLLRSRRCKKCVEILCESSEKLRKCVCILLLLTSKFGRAGPCCRSTNPVRWPCLSD